MKRHTIQGLSFVAACVFIGGAVFFGLNLPKDTVEIKNRNTISNVSNGQGESPSPLNIAAPEDPAQNLSASDGGSTSPTLVGDGLTRLNTVVETPAEFPSAFRGVWATDRSDCDERKDGLSRMKVDQKSYAGWEFGAQTVRLRSIGPRSIAMDYDYVPEGEDKEQTGHAVWTLDPSLSTLRESENSGAEATTYQRCA